MAGQGLRRWLVAAGTAAAAVALSAVPALAHVSLAGAEPAAGSTVTDAPATVALTFDGALEVGGDHAVGLFAPGGAQVDDGEVLQLTDRGVQVGVGELGEVGTYTVRWLVVGADGHNIEGDYTFTYDGPVVTVGTPPGPSTAPTRAPGLDASESPERQGEGGPQEPGGSTGSSEEAPGADEERSASPSPQADPTEVTATPEPAEPGGRTGALLPAAVGAAAALGVGVVLLRRGGGDPET